MANRELGMANRELGMANRELGMANRGNKKLLATRYSLLALSALPLGLIVC